MNGELSRSTVTEALKGSWSVTAAAVALGVKRPKLARFLELLPPKQRQELERSVEAARAKRVRQSLKAAGSIDGAARELGLSKNTLRKWMDRHNLTNPWSNRHPLTLKDVRRAIQVHGGPRHAAKALGVTPKRLGRFLDGLTPKQRRDIERMVERRQELDRKEAASEANRIRAALGDSEAVSEAARRLGISRSGLVGKMKRLGLTGPASPRNRLTFEQVAAALQEHRTKDEAAEALGVSRRTFYRYLSDLPPKQKRNLDRSSTEG